MDVQAAVHVDPRGDTVPLQVTVIAVHLISYSTGRAVRSAYTPQTMCASCVTRVSLHSFTVRIAARLLHVQKSIVRNTPTSMVENSRTARILRSVS